MESDFALSRNAQFFSTENELTDENVLGILDAATQGSQSANSIVNDQFRIEGPNGSYRYSSRIFSRTTRPYFHQSPELEDLQFGFIVLIEAGGHLAVLRLRCEDTHDHLEGVHTLLGLDQLKHVFDEDSSEFQKLNVRNMTIAERALRARSYEALNLKGLLSLHAAGRSIPSYVRIRDSGVTKSITLNSGRVTESTNRESIENIASWALTVIDHIKKGKGGGGFLDNFAKIVDLDDTLKITKPRSILIETSTLKDKLEENSIKIRMQLRNGRELRFTNRNFSRILELLDTVYEFDDDRKVVGHEGSAWLKSPAVGKQQKTLTFHSRTLQRIFIDDGGPKQKTLQSYIIQNGLFSICFDDPKYMYFAGKCFFDSSGTTEIDNLLKILAPIQELTAATCEKGSEVEGALSGHTSFPGNSVFGIVEILHADDDFIFCDDLGIEWADHITLNLKAGTINFIHSKHKKPTTSASALQDVIGQAMKNLGNMHFDIESFKQKHTSKLRNKIYPKSKIERVRKKTGQLPSFLEKLLGNYGLQRNVILACSFISQKGTIDALNKLKKGLKSPGHVVQLYWILSSFVHACRDAGVVPKIYCRP